jgi:hypothetical protein
MFYRRLTGRAPDDRRARTSLKSRGRRLKVLSPLAALALMLTTTQAFALVALYDFNGNLSDTLATAPDVGTIGSPVVGAGTAAFGALDGFKLSGVTTNYALETRINLTQAGNNSTTSFSKIFDFHDLGALGVDIGLYARQTSASGGNFGFFGTLGPPPGADNLASFTYGEFVTVGLTRNGSAISIFIDGALAASFTEDVFANAIPTIPTGGTEREINLFVDDTLTGGAEILLGAVDYIAINAGPEFLDVNAIRNQGEVAAPGMLAILGLGAIAVGSIRHRKAA